jgi:hypothetical protein
LSALGVYREYGYDTTGLIADFSSLSPPLQENCHSALSLAIKGGAGIDAAAVFKALADGISIPPPPPRGASDIVIDYVAAVAATWRSSGLRAGRALRPKDPSYTSTFHRFCDLVLTAVVEPESHRHQKGLDLRSKEAWAHKGDYLAKFRNTSEGGSRGRTPSGW